MCKPLKNNLSLFFIHYGACFIVKNVIIIGSVKRKETELKTVPLFDSLIQPALKSVTDLIEQFHLSPEDKLKAEQAIREAQAKAIADAQQYDVQLNTIAGQNIRAETSSTDKYTERARPSFLYVVIGVFAFNYIGIPFAEIFGSKVQPIQLPGDLLTLFGVCITGYVMSRTAEKVAAMPGDSQVSVLGLKVGNKS